MLRKIDARRLGTVHGWLPAIGLASVVVCILWAMAPASGGSAVQTTALDVRASERNVSARQGGSRAVLQAEDFELIGALRVPLEISGYSHGGLALRRVEDHLRFLLTGHPRDNDPVFEIDVPGFDPDVSQAPRANLLRAYGDVYRGRKQVANSGNAIWTGDLEWFNEGLFWVYGDSYNVVGSHNPSLGLTQPMGQSYGPWRTSLHSHLTQGYVTTIPEWYAERYVSGRRLAVGSGLMSGNSRSSWGPMLAAIAAPTPKTPTRGTIEAIPLVQYSYEQRLTREDSYIPLTRPPDRPGGWWTQQDTINGAVWIDLPDKHGVVFFGVLGAGHVWYGEQRATAEILDPCADWQGPHAARYEPRWWIYDPMRFVPVTGGHPADVQPASVFDPAKIASTARGCLAQTTGGAFDATTRTLYVVSLEAEPMDKFSLPVIYAYRIRSIVEPR